MITSTSDHYLPGSSEGNSIKSMLLFCSSRAWRGGFRVLLQFSAALLTIFIIVGLLPGHLGRSSYKDVLTWSSEREQLSNLRIVVFGSPDVANSVVDPTNARTTWTEELCKQLNCTSHVSMVPSGRGLASNSIYAKELSELRAITAKTNITEKPADDYDFIGEQYPVPHSTPDLAAQIEKFLKMPPPEDVPHETLWVFSFGTWEIWNLAALPLSAAEEVIDSTVNHIFEQIEVLYKHSLVPKSVAFSDFWSNATNSQVLELTNPETVQEVDKRKLESFRVVFPKLFDVSLTPGWRARPKPAFPNSLTEHTRNVMWLTRYWDKAIYYGLHDFKDKGARKPEGYESADETESPGLKRRDDNGFQQRTTSVFDYLPASMRPKALNQTKTDNKRIIYAPYPSRNGVQVDNAQVILDVMTEEGMHISEVQDSQGKGTLPETDSKRFLNVWSPCVRTKTEDLTVDMTDVEVECSIPQDHLFHDAFTISNRAILGLGRPMVEKVLDKLFIRQPKTSWFY